jgi:two-component system response regulator BaeR
MTYDPNNPILIVEDEPELGKLLQEYLSRNGLFALIKHNGREAFEWLKDHPARLILLDLMLPGMDGLELCRAVRKASNVPIIMVTAKVEEIDRLLGLELGADDYICKPYSPREVVARVKAVLRRAEAEPEPAAASQQIELREDSLEIRLDGEPVSLTSVEFALFKLLFNEPGRIFPRQKIMDKIYDDYRVVSDRTVDSHIKKLRKKIDDTKPGWELIHSVYGVGYKYEPPPA